jgi:hypothetical protein
LPLFAGSNIAKQKRLGRRRSGASGAGLVDSSRRQRHHRRRPCLEVTANDDGANGDDASGGDANDASGGAAPERA